MIKSWVNIVTDELASLDLGSVVIIGSGHNDLIEQVAQSDARQVIIADPDPLRAKALHRKYVDRPAIIVLNVAVADTVGSAVLQRYNLSSVISLRTPTGLKTLFPGLRKTTAVQVETDSVETVLEKANLAHDAPHVLILGTTGEEMALLSQLTELSFLQRFMHIIVALPSAPLYQNASAGRDIRAHLEDAGFRIKSRDMSDPDIGFAHFRIDQALVAINNECTKLREAQCEDRATIERLTKLYEETAAAYGETRQQLETETQEVTNIASARDKITLSRDGYRTKLRQSKAEIKKLENALETSEAALVTAANAQKETETALAETTKKLGDGDARITVLKDELTTREAALATAANAQKETETTLAETGKTLSEKNARINELRSSLEEVKGKYEALQQSTSVLNQSLDNKAQHTVELEDMVAKSRVELARVDGQIKILKDLLLKSGV